VTLHINADKESVTFAVSDTGIGIRKADINKIFKRFYRAEDYRTRETNGTGLGLYVSTKLAKKLGCKIDVESRINHGSKFSFKLPKSN
jgi:signal transduction histidine kinase